MAKRVCYFEGNFLKYKEIIGPRGAGYKVLLDNNYTLFISRIILVDYVKSPLNISIDDLRVIAQSYKINE